MSIRYRMVQLGNLLPGSVASALTTDAKIVRVIRPIANRLLPSTPTSVIVRAGPARGVRLLIQPRHEKYYWTGMHESTVQRTIASIVKPGMIVWDIGAHIGLYSMIASRIVGSAGEVHAFEPMKANRERLHSVIRMNNAANVTVHNVAISDIDAVTMLHAHQSSTMWTLIPELGQDTGHAVQCQRIDTIAKFVPSPNVIKIDVEGSEYQVISGGIELIDKQRPIILIEFSNDDTVQRTMDLLKQYRFKRVDERHWHLIPLAHC